MPSIAGQGRSILRPVVEGAVGLAFAMVTATAQSQLWLEQFGTDTYDVPTSAASDGSGGTYVVGWTFGSLAAPNAGLQDAWIARFDGNGNRLWIRQLGTSQADYANAVAADGPHGFYVSGQTAGSLGGPNAGREDAWLARYDETGMQLWIRQLGTHRRDAALTAAPDASGGVHVGGWTYGSLGGPIAGIYDCWIARYDGSGNQLWIDQFGTSESESPNAASPDGAGGFYLTGETTGNLGATNAGGVDVWLARFDGAGDLKWIHQFGTGAGDFSNAAATIGTSGAYFSGATFGDLGGPSAGDVDAWVARYDGAGNQQWLRQFGSSGADLAQAACLDESRGIFLVGATSGDLGGPLAGLEDVWLARYDAAGNELWKNQFGTAENEAARVAAADGAGGVFVGGYVTGQLAKASSIAEDVWLARYDGSCNSGKTYCTASSTSLPGCTASLSATGSPTLSSPTAWTVSTSPVPGGNLGLLLFGSSGPDNTPYGTLGGKVCVATPTFRTAPKTSGGDQGQCNGGYAFTLADLIAAAPIVTSGETVNAQVWARDPGNADGFRLSDGMEVVVCP